MRLLCSFECLCGDLVASFGGSSHQNRDLVVMEVFCRGVPEYWKGEGESHEEIDYSEGNCDKIRRSQDD